MRLVLVLLLHELESQFPHDLTGRFEPLADELRVEVDERAHGQRILVDPPLADLAVENRSLKLTVSHHVTLTHDAEECLLHGVVELHSVVLQHDGGHGGVGEVLPRVPTDSDVVPVQETKGARHVPQVTVSVQSLIEILLAAVERLRLQVHPVLARVAVPVQRLRRHLDQGSQIL